MKKVYEVRVKAYWNLKTSEYPVSRFYDYPSEDVIKSCVAKWKEESPDFNIFYAYVQEQYLFDKVNLKEKA